MFTGIVEGLGSIAAIKGSKLTVKAPSKGLKLGDSVAVNGVCLTVIKKGAALDFDVSPETFKRTNLGALKPGAKVNLERPLTPQSPVGGHYVSGHVDTVVELLEKEPQDDFIRLRFTLPKDFAKYVALKGSVALDGVSLTVTGVGRDWAETVLVPHTLKKTTLGVKGPGDTLNLEVDLLARYVQRLLETK